MRVFKFIIALLVLIISSTQAIAQCGHPDDITALKAIFYALDGPNWKQNDGTLYSDNVNLSCSTCTAADLGMQENIEVFCNSNNRVEELHIRTWADANNWFNGQLPDEIGLLSELKVLKIFDGSFQIDPCYQKLNIYGELPPTMANLTKLESIFIKNTNISGDLRGIFSNMPNLKNITIVQSEISGISQDFISSLSNKTQFTTLVLSSNKLSGILPSNFSTALPNSLIHCDLSNNYLEGLLPSDFSFLGFNSLLNISNNNFSGCIPDELRKYSIELKWGDYLTNPITYSNPLYPSVICSTFHNYTPNDFDYRTFSEFKQSNSSCLPHDCCPSQASYTLYSKASNGLNVDFNQFLPSSCLKFNAIKIIDPSGNQVPNHSLIPCRMNLGGQAVNQIYTVTYENDGDSFDCNINLNIQCNKVILDTPVYTQNPCTSEQLVVDSYYSNANVFTSNSLFPNPKVQSSRYSDVAVDHSGNVYTLISKMQSNGKGELQIFKNGGPYQVYIGDSHSVQGTEIRVDDTGNVYVTGSFRGASPHIKNATIGHKLESQCDGSNDCVNSFVIKFDSNFTSVIWDLVLKSDSYTYIEDLHLLNSNSFAIAGRSIGKTNFDPHFTNYENSSHNTKKAFLSKYTVNSSKPKMDWTRTIYGQAAHQTRVDGFGVTSDDFDNIFLCGGWGQVTTSHAGVAIDGLGVQNWQVPSPNHSQGFVVAYDSNGNYQGSTNVAANGYLKDIEYYNGKIYGVGLTMTAVINNTNGALSLISADHHTNEYYEEIDISNVKCNDGRIYITNWSGNYKPTLKIMDENFNPVYEIQQSGSPGFAASLSIDVKGQNVVWGTAFSKSQLLLNSPHTTSPQVQYSGNGQADYVTTKFKCDCNK